MGDVVATAGTGLPVLVILGCLSLLSLTLIAVKTLRLWPVTKGAEARDGAIAALMRGRGDEASRTLGAGRSPADRVAAAALPLLKQGMARADLEAELTRLGNAEVSNMMRHIRLLELIAMVSPLLGLLGTVLGMITSFQELELAAGAANASILAGGIWQALLTTAAGLVVAIPAAIGAGLLAARAEAGAVQIESVIAQMGVVHGSRQATP